jgi:hypothetical protein
MGLGHFPADPETKNALTYQENGTVQPATDTQEESAADARNTRTKVSKLDFETLARLPIDKKQIFYLLHPTMTYNCYL